MNEVVVTNVLHVEGVHNLLSQSRLMDRGLRIVPVNGFGIKIYDKHRQRAPVEEVLLAWHLRSEGYSGWI